MARFVARAGHWNPARWAKPSRAGIDGSAALLGPTGSAGPPTRADLVAGLVQQLADVCADVEGQPRRRVPRLESEPALTDQVRVMVADLIAAARAATEDAGGAPRSPAPAAACTAASAAVSTALELIESTMAAL